MNIANCRVMGLASRPQLPPLDVKLVIICYCMLFTSQTHSWMLRRPTYIQTWLQQLCLGWCQHVCEAGQQVHLGPGQSGDPVAEGEEPL